MPSHIENGEKRMLDQLKDEYLADLWESSDAETYLHGVFSEECEA